MKKSLAIILALSMLIALCAGCGDSNKPTGESQPVAQEGEPSEDPNSGAGGAEIALICSAGGGSINDRGFSRAPMRVSRSSARKQAIRTPIMILRRIRSTLSMRALIWLC